MMHGHVLRVLAVSLALSYLGLGQRHQSTPVCSAPRAQAGDKTRSSLAYRSQTSPPIGAISDSIYTFLRSEIELLSTNRYAHACKVYEHALVCTIYWMEG